METTVRRVNQVVYLAILLWMLWIMIPAHKRNRILLAGADRLRRALLAMARAAGATGIDLELSGHQDAAQAQYGVAYRLMTAGHDRVAAWYRSLSGQDTR